MKKLSYKKNNKGFSLTELLVAVLILSMVSAVVAGGIPVAKDAYEKITVSANAQVMLSTTISALRNELCTASDLSVEEVPKPKWVRYYNPSISNYSKISIGKSNDETYQEKDTILIKHFSDKEPKEPKENETDNTRTLVSKAIGEGKLYVTYDEVLYDEGKGVITFTNLKVMDATGDIHAHLKDEDNKIQIRLIKP